MNTDKKHALVIGSSMAGMLAARALADHFERVTIAERDIFPAGAEPRKGLPQARHVHILLMKGQECLEKFFPGLEDELGRAGAPHIDWTGDASWFTFGGWSPRFPSGYCSHPCSRDLLESVIRGRLSAIPQVQFLEAHEAVQLLTTPDRSRVTGARLRLRGRPDQDGLDLLADLVVDASGRDSRVPHWLETLGYPPPPEIVVNSFLGYATRVYQRPPDLNDWAILLVRGTPPTNSRGGVIYAIEGDRLMVTLGAPGRDYPPTDEEGFLAFARSLPVPTLYDAIKDAVPLTSISGYRKTENRWRHYEHMPRWPENLVVVGDAACAFNPVYGQGMSVAALEALVLGECLRSRPAHDSQNGLAREMQKKIAGVINAPWLLATGDDYRIPQTEGRPLGFTTRLMHGYIDHVLYIANHSQAVFLTFFEVAHLLKPLTEFFRPGILSSVLKRVSGQVFRRNRDGASGPGGSRG